MVALCFARYNHKEEAIIKFEDKLAEKAESQLIELNDLEGKLEYRSAESKHELFEHL